MLEEEERIYATYLKNVLQDSVVPRIFISRGWLRPSFLSLASFLEDCGDAVTTRFDKLPLEDRRKSSSRF